MSASTYFFKLPTRALQTAWVNEALKWDMNFGLDKVYEVSVMDGWKARAIEATA